MNRTESQNKRTVSGDLGTKQTETHHIFKRLLTTTVPTGSGRAEHPLLESTRSAQPDLSSPMTAGFHADPAKTQFGKIHRYLTRPLHLCWVGDREMNT